MGYEENEVIVWDRHMSHENDEVLEELYEADIECMPLPKHSSNLNPVSIPFWRHLFEIKILYRKPKSYTGFPNPIPDSQILYRKDT